MEQLNLFSGINSEKFPEYHKDNPYIYEAFKKYTFESIERKFKNFSAEFVFNIIRWETAISGNDTFKMNNNYKAFYSRMFMNEYPEYKGYFRTRKSKYD
jgi:hypothetical protein